MTDQIFLNKQRVLDKVKVLDKEFDFILVGGACWGNCRTSI